MFHIDLIRFLFVPHLMCVCVCLYKILICIFVALDQKQIKIKTFNFGDTWQIRLHRTFHFYLFGNWSNVKKVVENVHVSLSCGTNLWIVVTFVHMLNWQSFPFETVVWHTWERCLNMLFSKSQIKSQSYSWR